MKKQNNSQFSIFHYQLLIVIPAIKKNAVIPDQLVKKLNGITLIQRAINTAKQVSNNILVVTDSEEISLICERNKVKYYKDITLRLNSDNIIEIINSIVKTEKDILLFRANTPLITKETLIDAYNVFQKNRDKILVSVKKIDKRIFNYNLKLQDGVYEELKAFYIYNKNFKEYYPYVIDSEEAIEIESYQDWWVCEKLLQRKRVVFNVIGNTKVGMGHIYRALSLAHHITNHDILFVCDEKDELVVESIASKDYKVIPSQNKLNTILSLQPDLVINDILNTDINYIDTLRKNNIKVVNFEDLGEGVKRANIVFNELYDIPVIDGDNILWGYEWYFLRDEFDEAKQNNFENVKNVLITFGGTDQHNLTLKTLKIVKDYPFKITIVCGGGYLYKTELQEYVNKNNLDVEIIYKTGVISKKMENIQIAITSNGRTVYELAHMHIPSIIVSQHKREETHHFSKLENGFIRLGNFEEIDDFDKKFRYYFDKILDNDYRYLLFLNTKKFNFLNNKQKVIRKILDLIEK